MEVISSVTNSIFKLIDELVEDFSADGVDDDVIVLHTEHVNMICEVAYPNINNSGHMCCHVC